MVPSSPKKPLPENQSDKFKAMAKELECEDSSKPLDKALRMAAKPAYKRVDGRSSPVEHWSDCAIHNDDSGKIAACNCGRLELRRDDLHIPITAFVTASGGIRLLVNHMGREGFIEPHQLPSNAFSAYATAANLPDAHDRIVIIGKPDGMDLDDARVAVISQLQALASPEGFDGGLAPHGITSQISI
jgi:hypothetical protein